MRQGIIKKFSGSWGSGLGFLIIEDSVTGEIESVPCDNGPTVRALEGCFGNVIGNSHNVKEDAGYIDQEIYWDYDDLGLTLEGFTPVGEILI